GRVAGNAGAGPDIGIDGDCEVADPCTPIWYGRVEPADGVLVASPERGARNGVQLTAAEVSRPGAVVTRRACHGHLGRLHGAGGVRSGPARNVPRHVFRGRGLELRYADRVVVGEGG